MRNLLSEQPHHDLRVLSELPRKVAVTIRHRLATIGEWQHKVYQLCSLTDFFVNNSAAVVAGVGRVFVLIAAVEIGTFYSFIIVKSARLSGND